MRIHVGTSGYGYGAWKGKFYPPQLPPGEMLRFYAGRLGAVEVNNTFYRMPTGRLLASWAGQVPADFLFALKAPQLITHRKRLKDVDEEAGHLFRTVPVLEGRLGPLLFQFPPSFPADLLRLTHFLGLIPAGLSCAFEFRHPSWIAGEIPALLAERGFCLCTADTDEHPAGELAAAAGWGYLRLRRSDYTVADLAQWLARIRAQRWERAFVFFKHEEEARGPALALRFRELVAETAAGAAPP